MATAGGSASSPGASVRPPSEYPPPIGTVCATVPSPPRPIRSSPSCSTRWSPSSDPPPLPPCTKVYGALPAETRREQARLFNTPGSGFDVLIATDAIGMGLNLNIRRVVFTTLTKWSPFGSPSGGPGEERISDSAIKQLAGRAGRRNRYEVPCWQSGQEEQV